MNRHALLAVLLATVALAGCTAAQQAKVDAALAKPAGQLFCAIQTKGGGQIVASVIDGVATAAAPNAAPVAIVATNMGKAFVDAACARAALAVGGVTGVPVSPPAADVPVAPVAVVPPLTA